MSLQRCGACDAKVRKTQHATVLGADGARPKRVCDACARRGVLLVPRVVPPTMVIDERGEKRAAVEVMRPIARRVEAIIKGIKGAPLVGEGDGGEERLREYEDGRLDALTSVLGMLTGETDAERGTLLRSRR